jgi:hypothetical protein
MAFSFFITAEHAFGKAISAIQSFGKKGLPAIAAALPAIETGVATAATVAEVVLPEDAALIAAVNNASQTMLAKSLVAANGASALAQAAANGTLTISASVDEVNALKALVAPATDVIASLGLSHALAPVQVLAPVPLAA